MKTYLSLKEIDSIIALIPYTRDKLILRILSRTGIRVSELLQIKVEDVDFEDEVISIVHLKKRVEDGSVNYRLIAIDPETLEFIGNYIKAMGLGPKDRIISLSRQSVYALTRYYAEAKGFGKELRHPISGRKHYFSPHKCRDALAVHWLMKDGSMEGAKSLQEQLGHKKFDTTLRYFKLSIDNVKKVYSNVMSE